MAYLAATLGQLDDLQFDPVTDDISHLNHFLNASSSSEGKVSSLRLEILENLFPAPNTPLSASQLSDFKGKHGDKLNKFRLNVEKEIIEIADINDPYLKQRRLDIFKVESAEAIQEIKNEMNKSGFKHLTLGKLGSIVSAIPGVSAIFGLASAVYGAFEKNDIGSIDSSFLYAAYAQEEILKN